MGGTDKPLREVCGTSLLAHVLSRLGHGPADTLLSVNDNLDRYGSFGAVVLADTVAGSLGPLAGILAGLDWIADHAPEADLLVAPADTPFLPRDLLHRLRGVRALRRTELSCAASAGRLHPVASLWRARHAGAVRAALSSDERRLTQVMRRIGLSVAEFDADPADPFFNVNTPQDLAQAEVRRRADAARSAPLLSPRGQD